MRLILEGVEEFYLQDPSRLQGQFDLAFLINVLAYDLGHVATLLRGETPRVYWSDPDPELFKVSSMRGRVSPLELRPAEAHIFCGSFGDIWLG